MHQKSRPHLQSACAPQVGLEPTTTRLTAGCSAIELLRNMENGVRQRPILPGRVQPSTFGTEELNCCVRYGNRWNLSVITTGPDYFITKMIGCQGGTSSLFRAIEKIFFLHVHAREAVPKLSAWHGTQRAFRAGGSRGTEGAPRRGGFVPFLAGASALFPRLSRFFPSSTRAWGCAQVVRMARNARAGGMGAGYSPPTYPAASTIHWPCSDRHQSRKAFKVGFVSSGAGSPMGDAVTA